MMPYVSLTLTPDNHSSSLFLTPDVYGAQLAKPSYCVEHKVFQFCIVKIQHKLLI